MSEKIMGIFGEGKTVVGKEMSICVRSSSCRTKKNYGKILFFIVNNPLGDVQVKELVFFCKFKQMRRE